MTNGRHAYGDHRSQFADLRLPQGDGPFPVAAVIHGGCFRPRYDLTGTEAICADLAGRGWASWNIEYRRLGLRSGGGWPQTFGDVSRAIDTLPDIDAPLDLTRMAVIGHSAGGCLALWAAGRDRPRVPVTAAVGQAPLADLTACARDGVCGGQVQRMLGGEPESEPERYREASPAERLPLRCRTLLVHGALDDTVPQSHTVAFAAAAGERCATVLPEHEGHMEHVDPGSESWRAVAEWL
ncbi:MAG: alpha/beta hydrolase family protein [Gaiellales bacterium]